MSIHNSKNGSSRSRSTLISTLNKVFGRLYESVSKSMFGTFLSSHSSLEKKFSHSLSSTLLCGNRGSRGTDALFEESATVGAFRRLKKSILRSDMMSAVLFIVFSVLFVFVARVAKETASGSLVLVKTFADLLVIILFAVPSLLMGFANRHRSLGELISESKLLQIFFNDILGVGDEYYYEYKRKAISKPSNSVLLALIIGVISYFVSPFYIVISILLASFTLLVASVPEAGVMAVVFFMPFIDLFAQAESVLIAFAAITEISVLIKITRKKRKLHMSLIDAFVLLFAAFTFLGGIPYVAGLDAFITTLKYSVIILFYFPIKCVICDNNRIYSCFVLTVSSGLIISLASLFSGIIGAISEDMYVYLFGSAYDGKLRFPFETSTELGIFLAVIIIMCFGVFGRNELESRRFRRAALCILTLMCACVILTYSITAIVALILGLLIFFLLRSHKTLTVITLAVAPAVLLLVIVIPILGSASGSSYYATEAENIISSVYRGGTWASSFELIRDNWFAGVGTASFQIYYPSYALPGTENSVNCGSLYLDILSRLGVFGFAVFVIIIFMNMRAGFEFIRRSEDGSLTLKAKSALSAMFLLSMASFVCSIWHDVRLMLAFWILLALTGAVLDVGYRRAEEEKYQLLFDENAVDMRLYM